MIGLTTHQAEELLKKYGLNALPQKQNSSALKVFLKQVQNPLSYLLIGAVVLSFYQFTGSIVTNLIKIYTRT